MTEDTKTPKGVSETGVSETGIPAGGTKSDDKRNPANAQDKMEERLDDALEETFPSSDPVSVKITK